MLRSRCCGTSAWSWLVDRLATRKTSSQMLWSSMIPWPTNGPLWILFKNREVTLLWPPLLTDLCTSITVYPPLYKRQTPTLSKWSTSVKWTTRHLNRQDGWPSRFPTTISSIIGQLEVPRSHMAKWSYLVDRAITPTRWTYLITQEVAAKRCRPAQGSAECLNLTFWATLDSVKILISGLGPLVIIFTPLMVS